MFPQQHSGDWSADDDQNENEYIDLTGSPASPSPRPQHLRPPRQQHLARRFTSGPAEMEPSQPGSAGTVPPTIHIDQLRRIIDTTDQHAVRTVLLNLCKLSPALSGAVARGLAPQSSYARQTIRAYQVKKAASGAIPCPGQETQTTCGRAKKAPGSTLRTAIALSDDDDDDDLAGFKFEWDDEQFAAPAGSSSAAGRTGKPAPVKTERRSSSTSLPVRPAAYAASAISRPTPSRETTVFNTPPKSSTETKVKTELGAKPSMLTCRNCNKVIEDRDEPCIYHPGLKTVITTQDRRLSVYSCCKRAINKAGCCTSTHDIVTTPRLPGGSARDPKKPRLV